MDGSSLGKSEDENMEETTLMILINILDGKKGKIGLFHSHKIESDSEVNQMFLFFFQREMKDG